MLKVGEIITLKMPFDNIRGIGTDFIVTSIKDGIIAFKGYVPSGEYSGTITEKLLDKYFYWFDADDVDMDTVTDEVDIYINNNYCEEEIKNDNCLVQTIHLPWGFTITKSYKSSENLTTVDPDNYYEGDDPYSQALEELTNEVGEELEQYEKYHQLKSAYEEYVAVVDSETPYDPKVYKMR